MNANQEVTPAARPAWRRRQTLVNPSQQLRFASVLLIEMTVIMLVIAGFGFAESQSMLSLVLRHVGDLPLPAEHLHYANQTFLMKIIGLIGLTAIVQILFGIHASHKIAGPAVQMTRVLAQATRGDFAQRVRFRDGDQLESLAISLNAVLARLNDEQNEHRKEVEDIAAAIDRLSARGNPTCEELHAIRIRLARIAEVEVKTPAGVC